MKLGSKPRKPLARESAKTIREKPIRRAIVAKLLSENPVCQIGSALKELDHPQGRKCWGRSTEVHEVAKRSLFPGSHLLAQVAVACCRSCHEWTESGDPTVRELGFLLSHCPEVDDLVAQVRAEQREGIEP